METYAQFRKRQARRKFWRGVNATIPFGVMSGILCLFYAVIALGLVR